MLRTPGPRLARRPAYALLSLVLAAAGLCYVVARPPAARAASVITVTNAATSLVFSQTARVGAVQKGGDEQALRKLIDELAAAVGRNDVAALDRIYADGFTFVSDTGALVTKAQRLAALKSGELKYESVSFDEVNVRLYGDTAVATFRATSRGQSNGQSFSGPFRVTTTFVKMKGRWQEVSAQSTPITGQ